MTDFKSFATLVRTMRDHQKKRERSSARLLAEQTRHTEARVDAAIAELFGEHEDVEQPKMEL